MRIGRSTCGTFRPASGRSRFQRGQRPSQAPAGRPKCPTALWRQSWLRELRTRGIALLLTPGDFILTQQIDVPSPACQIELCRRRDGLLATAAMIDDRVLAANQTPARQLRQLDLTYPGS